MRLFFSLIAIALIVSPVLGDDIQFNRDIRPILSDKCFACHGPDPKTREADLRLDVREAAVSDRGGYFAIAPEKATESELISRVTSDDPDMVMPPPEFNKPVTPEEAALLKKWIEEGAEYEAHWSYTPVKRPEVPGQAANPIDAFIQRRLQEKGFSPSQKAESRVLVRRLAFDLTGLPPSPETVEEFANNPTEEAYKKLVEKFLASEHYGERLAIYWLDLVRYADTLGFHGDQVRSVSPYRDYVIRAFNENKPFDEFTVEQIAGDLLPEADLWQKVASTYNRLNRASGEGGVQPKEYLAKYSADRVRTAGTVWLGSTFGCAECHDHKFDPFTTHDFYSFAAFFADIKEQGIVGGARHIELLPVPTPEQEQQKAQLEHDIHVTETEYNKNTPELAAAQEAWEQEILEQSKMWVAQTPSEMKSQGGATMEVADDQSVRVTGKSPEKDTYEITIPLKELPFAGLRLEVLPDDKLPAKGPGRAGNGNFVLHAVNATIDGTPVKWEAARATHTQNNHSPEYVINGHQNGWAILPETGKPQQLILTPQVDESITGDGEHNLKLEIVQNYGSSHTIGRFRIYTSKTKPISGGTFAAEEIAAIVNTPADQRNDQQRSKLNTAFREQTPLLKETREHLAALRQQLTALDNSIVTTLGTKSTTPREMRVLPRGNWMDDSGEVVEPAIPAFLSTSEAAKDERLTRLDLANWLVDKNNPLVARTFMNRLWMLFYGHGLARSVDDLGSQGSLPTHPELLDWLAAEFMESGWDIKHMVTLMLTSQTYRQSSQPSEQLRKEDPYNRYFARQSRWRLEAEMIRDNALAVSGLLVEKVGGVSVKPYQPAGYWAQLNFPKRTYQHDTGESQYRRGLYTHWQRTFLHPSMLAFDASPREECTAKRERSNTPLQSLVLLNDPTYVEVARVLAARMLQEADGSFAERLDWVMQQVLNRTPNAEESDLLSQLYTASLERYGKSPDEAGKLLTTGLAPVPEQLDKTELAAWTAVTRAILNLHETITRY